MKKLFLLFVSAALMTSCGSDGGAEKRSESKKEDQKQELLNLITRLEGEMHRSAQLDNVIAGQAIQAYDDYHKQYPDDSVCADFMFKAAEIATASKQYDQALVYYQTLMEEYGNYPLLEEAYFLKAVIWDQYKNDDVRAKDAYEHYLRTYPAGKYTADVKAAISNLGKSDEELIKEFEKKNKGK